MYCDESLELDKVSSNEFNRNNMIINNFLKESGKFSDLDSSSSSSNMSNGNNNLKSILINNFGNDVILQNVVEVTQVPIQQRK